MRPPDSGCPSIPASANGGLVAADKNTFAKCQRETLNRQNAEATQARRRKRKETPDITNTRPASGDFAGPSLQDAYCANKIVQSGIDVRSFL
jgi:hypothetical protein